MKLYICIKCGYPEDMHTKGLCDEFAMRLKPEFIPPWPTDEEKEEMVEYAAARRDQEDDGA